MMKIDFVFNLFTSHGDKEYLAEGLSHTSHMIQTAILAEKDNQPPEVVLGALLHDIGILIGKAKGVAQVKVDGVEVGPKDHDQLGANFLKDCGFPLEIYCFASHHAQAIRYLAFKDPSFVNGLPALSQATLARKGGPLTKMEAREFEKLPHFDAIVKCRQWDELGRDPNAKIEPIEKYIQMAKDYAASLKK